MSFCARPIRLIAVRPIAVRLLAAGFAIAVWWGFLSMTVTAQTADFEREPILYHTTPVNDAVARLNKQITAGDKTLQWDEKTGWLKSLLGALNVPESSQTLVFSKTSLQLSRISSRRPRAIYFSDDVYVGWVQNGGVIEVSAVDQHQGPVFYSIPQTSDEFTIRRDKGECLSCHASAKTKSVPGYLVRSVFPGPDGTPHYGLGTTTTDHSTPFKDRFGGWYVTGRHGEMPHRGNAIADEESDPPIDPKPGANRTTLDGLVRTEPYLVQSSDIVALMILEHQSQMHNLITRANYESRMAAHHDKAMNRLLKREDDYVSDSTRRRIKSAGDKLLAYMLMSDEWPLTSPVQGNSEFQKVFEASGKRDRRGRSLRQLDLEKRLFKYPCSFLIQSDSYRGMPEDMREYVESRLADILTGRDGSGQFEHLSQSDRKAILEILSNVLPGFDERL